MIEIVIASAVLMVFAFVFCAADRFYCAEHRRAERLSVGRVPPADLKPKA